MKNIDRLQATYNSEIKSVLNDNQKKLYKDDSAQWWKDISGSAAKPSANKKY